MSWAPTPTPEKSKPKILSVCMHGKSDSWATKLQIEEHLERAKMFDIIARGVAPQGKPHQTPEGLRGVELTLDEIRQAVLILIHGSNEYKFRERFGPLLTSALDTSGLLYVRTGIECQHLTKNTDRPNGRIAECCKIYRQLLDSALTHGPAESIVHAKAFVAAAVSDEMWHEAQLRRNRGKGGRRKEKR